MSDPRWFRWPRDVVRVSGPDAVSYLQGQLSQDIEPLAAGATTWALALHPQGKVASWLRLTRVAADAFLADVDGGYGVGLVERLGRFKLRTKIEIEPLVDWGVIAVRGEGLVTPEPSPGTWSLPFDWNGWTGFDLIGPGDVVVAPVGAELDAEAFHVERIEARFPMMGAEVDDDTIPAEVGVVAAAVSFTKGCFVGQELVARIDSRGATTPRVLRLIRAGSGLLAARDDLVIDGAVVGRVTSAAADVGLALVKRAVAPPVTTDNGAIVVS